MFKKTIYRHCRATIGKGYYEWLMDKYGTKYYFHYDFEKTTYKAFWWLDQLPQFSRSYKADTTKQIITELNLTGVVQIKNW